jgi:hypothetical protein
LTSTLSDGATAWINFVGPNGLAFSPDESVLYIIDARRRQIRAFDMLPNGTLSKQTERLFADLGGSEPGNPDGMKSFRYTQEIFSARFLASGPYSGRWRQHVVENDSLRGLEQT